MSRIINPDSAGKEREQLTKAVVLAIREMVKQKEPDEESYDLAAFIALALDLISETIDISVTAWEKRDYWLKADKFRMEWAWSGQYAQKMKRALFSEDWAGIAMVTAQVAQKLKKVNVPLRHRLGKPWMGAWTELQKKMVFSKTT